MSGTAAERAVATNEAAFRFWLRAAGIADLPDLAALRRFAAGQPEIFAARMAEFAGATGAEADAAALFATLIEADRRPDDPPWRAGAIPDPQW
jgi:hypothetical protein